MIDRVRDWWQGRSDRERWMLGVMLALLAILVLWFAIIAPLNRARAAAEQRLSVATEDAGRVAAAAGAMKIARRDAQPMLNVALPVAIGQAAEANGFTLARLDPIGGDRATIGISTARGPALFTWLNALEKQGVIVEKLTLRTNSDGTLAVEGVLRTRAR